MRIVCPKCELKGQIDVAPRGAKTRIACVRCATTFDAVFADGEIQVVQPQAGRAVATVGSAGIEARPQGDVLTVGAEIVPMPETPHAMQFDASLSAESSPAAADDFFASSQDLILETTGETALEAETAPQEFSGELPPLTDDRAPLSAETLVHETADAAHAPFAVAQSPASDGVGNAGRPPSDVYGMGVRLMRVSPLWLLLAGLGFITFIVFCNWLIKPSEQPGDAAGLMAAANNHATNQSAKRPTVPTSTAQSTVNRQVSQPSDEPGVAYIATEAKAASQAVPAASLNVEAVTAKDTGGAKQATPSPSSNPAGGAKEGKVTIQVGSYTVAAEADKRVADLKSAGFEARSVQVEIPKRGTWYRVQSGRFGSRDEAERYGRQLRDKGVASNFITTDVQE